jgi:hypothetical protein
VYFALGSIIGNTFVSEAAANTVGVEPPDAAVVEGEVVVGAEVVALEVLLLLPQPAAKAEIPIVRSSAAARLGGFELNNGSASSSMSRRRVRRQNPSRVLASWR